MGKYDGWLDKCLSANQQAEVEEKKKVCLASGGSPRYNPANGLWKSCVYPNNNPNPWVFKPYCPPSKYPICGCPPSTLPSMSSGDDDWDWDYQPGNRQWVCLGIQTGRYAELNKCAGDVMDDDRWPLKLRRNNISNHTRGNKFYSSFTFRHGVGTIFELDLKPNFNGYTLNRYGDMIFKATDKLIGQNVELTLKASAWR